MNAAVSGGNPIRAFHPPPPTTFPRFPPHHKWFDNMKKVFLLHGCARDCLEELVCSTALHSRLPAGVASYRRETVRSIASDIIHRKFHLIIALFELFKMNARSVVVEVVGGRWRVISRICERMRKKYNFSNQILTDKFKNEIHYSWLITSGSDCMNTNASGGELMNLQQTS